MPVVQEYSGDDTVTLNWTIQQYSLNSLCTGKSITSPGFDSKKLGDCRWRLELFPRGSHNSDYVAVYVWSEADDATGEYDGYTLTLSLRIGDTDLHVKTKKCEFQGSDSWKCNEFVSLRELEHTRLPDDQFKIVCVISPERNCRRSDLQDMTQLSQDLISLLESEQFYDFVFITDDGTRFKVHDRIMTARWPFLKGSAESISEREGKIFGISSQTLETMIRYAYSGTLNVTNVPRDMFRAAVRKDFGSLRKNLTCFPKAYYAITELNIEHKIVVWHFGDVSSWERTPLPFIRVLPTIELYVYEIILIFNTKRDEEGDEVIDVAFRFSFFKPNFPISLNCKMHLSVRGGDVISEFREASHLFLNNDTWHFPRPIKTINIPDKKLTSMTLELTMSDGPKYSRIDKTETEFFSKFTPIRDLRKLSSDISLLAPGQGQNYRADCYLKPKSGERIPAHRVLLWARWPQMKSLLEPEVDEFGDDWTINTNIEESLLPCIIFYVYTGISEDIDVEKAQQILDTKAIIPLPELLLQKCKWIVENESNA